MAGGMPPAQEPFPNEPGAQPYPGPGAPPYPTSPGYPGYPGYPPYQPYGAPPPAPPRTGGVPWWAWLIGGCLGLAVIVGIACVALGFAAGHFVNTFAHETPVASTTTQTFTVSGTPSLTIHDTAGQVTVKTGDTKSVIVEITKNARDTSSSAAQNDLNAIAVSATQTGNAINVDANFNQAVSPFRQVTVDLVITVPPTANLSLQAEAGDVAIYGVSGRLTATLSGVSAALGGGNFEAHSVTLADGSNINVSSGDVTLDGSLAAGASVAVTANGGNANLTLPASTAARLDASTTFGNITITGWSIPVTRNNGSATATGDLSPNPSGTLTVHVTSGDITLTAGAS